MIVAGLVVDSLPATFFCGALEASPLALTQCFTTCNHLNGSYPASERPAEVDVHSAKLFEKFLTDKRKLVGFGTLEKTYPRYPDIADIRDTLTPEQRNSWIDLSPYVPVGSIACSCIFFTCML